MRYSHKNRRDVLGGRFPQLRGDDVHNRSTGHNQIGQVDQCELVFIVPLDSFTALVN